MIFGRRDHPRRAPQRAALLHRQEARARTIEERDRQARQTAGDAAMALRRWTVNQAVAWVATRSGQAVGRNKGSVGLTAFVAVLPGPYPIPRYNDAWRELAAEMVSGAVSAVGTEIQRDKVHGSRIERLGIRFPPADQPGLGLECFVAEEPPRTVVRPNGWLFVPRWTEYADLSFERAAVVAAFPPPKAEANQVPAIEAAAAPEDIDIMATPSEPEPAPLGRFSPHKAEEEANRIIAAWRSEARDRPTREEWEAELIALVPGLNKNAARKLWDEMRPHEWSKPGRHGAGNHAGNRAK